MTRDESRLSKRFFTVNERVLLHLKESGSTGHTLDMPAPMTQEGIASALGIRVNHVSRAVKALEKQGFIREATARVKGEVRKKKVYLITEEGMSVANKVLHEIGVTMVTVGDSRHRLREMSASEARSLMLPPRTYTTLLAHIDDRGILDILKVKAAKEKLSAVSHLAGAPSAAAFYGRTEELKKLRSWLQLGKPPMMAVTGEQGIGKTVLAHEAVKNLLGRKRLFWYTCSPATTLARVTEALSGFLQKLGRAQLSTSGSDEGRDIQDLRPELEASMVGLGAVFVIDGLPPDSGEITDICRVFIDAALAAGNRVLLTARELPPWKREFAVRGFLEELHLQGLDRESCRKIASNLDEEEFAKAYRLARGNPMEIKLLSEHAEDQEGVGGLTPEERALLRYLRVVHESR